MNILFRADSSSTIGTGHIMRDLVLAKQYPNDSVIFTVRELDGNINYKILEAGYRLEILESNDFNEIDNFVKKLNIDMMVIDHYGIDYVFEKKLKMSNPDLKIFVVDDTYKKHHCDILLNHNIYADEARYKDLVPKHCELRCGAKFTLLRDEFIIERKKTNVVKENIFIGMGGADSDNISQEILVVLTHLTNKRINVVTTGANPNIDSLKAFIAKYSNVELHIDSHQIANLMNHSLLAIISPSVILNELFYLDIPFIAIQTADNQKYMVEFLKKNGYDILENWEVSKFRALIIGKI